MAKKPVEVYNTSVFNSYAEWLRETKNNCSEVEQDQADLQNRPSNRTPYITTYFLENFCHTFTYNPRTWAQQTARQRVNY